GAAPDPETRRGIAIGADVEGDAFLLGKLDDLLCGFAAAVESETHRSVGTRLGIFRKVPDPWRALDPSIDDCGIGIGPRAERVQAAKALRPLQRDDVVLDAQHRGRVDRLAFENRGVELARFGDAENLGERPGRDVGLEPLDRTRREDEHAMRRLPAKYFLPGEGHDIELPEIELLGEG